MFNSITDAKTFIVNHGMFNFIDLDQEDAIAEVLYRNATDTESADEIIKSFVI